MADTNRVMTRDEMEAEIRACQALLDASDHKIIQTLEGILDCTTATGIINFLKNITGDVKELVTSRQGYRKTIRDLEEKLESTATQDAGE